MNSILHDMGPKISLTNHFLIAMPSLEDSHFARSVTYICEHNANGALGIVINRPSSVMLTEVFDQMQIHVDIKQFSDTPILYGGPVHPERGFVIHSPDHRWRSSFVTSDQLMVTTSRDILEAMAKNEGPKQALITLGCAGWEAGQLEQEIMGNSWLFCKADPHIIFDIPYEKRWLSAGNLLGIDLTKLAGDFGRA